MKISISEEKINTEAAALELVRGDILLGLEKELQLSQRPRSLQQLKEQLEQATLGQQRYPALKSRILTCMDPNKKVEDYKVEMYIRHFLIDPLLEDNYQRLMEMLRINLTKKFLPSFPITTVVFEPQAIAAFKLVSPNGRSPVESLKASLEAFFKCLDVVVGFETLCQVPSREVNYLESRIFATSSQDAQYKQMLSDTQYQIKVLEFNCGLLLDLCCQLLEYAIVNYSCSIIKPQEDLDQLRADFKKYIRASILKDNRYLGKTSPSMINQTVEKICKDVWARTRKKITADLEISQKNQVIMTYATRVQFKASYFRMFKDESESLMRTNLSMVPREGVFLYESYTRVKKNIDVIVNTSFDLMLTNCQQHSPELVKQDLNLYLNSMMDPHVALLFKHFPPTRGFSGEELLNGQMRQAIVIGALLNNPKSLIPRDYQDRLKHISEIATTLQVLDYPEVQKTFKVVSTIDSRKANREYIQSTLKNLEVYFSQLPRLDLSQVVFLVTGLYFLVTGASNDLEEMKRATSTGTFIVFKPVDYRKRRMLFQVIRLIKNGNFHMLNYQIVLILESLISRMQLVHNQMVSKYSSPTDQRYNFDYNVILKKFKEMKVSSLSRLLTNTGDPRNQQQSLFKSSFIEDTEFSESNVVVNGENIPIRVVDVGQTIERATDSPNSPKSGFWSGLFGFGARSKAAQIKPQPVMNQTTVFQNQEEELRFHGKLEYLLKNVRKMEFMELNEARAPRSRCPVMCLSGFSSEDCDKAADWKQVIDLFAHTEVITINWEALTPTAIVKALHSSLKKVSIRNIASLVISQLHGIVDKSKPNSEAGVPNEGAGGDLAEVVPTNPFDADNNDSQIVGRETTDSAQNGGGLFSLVWKARIKDVFTTENLTMVFYDKLGCSQFGKGGTTSNTGPSSAWRQKRASVGSKHRNIRLLQR